MELDPHNTEVLTDWGYSLFLQGKLSEAESALRMALKESPGDKRATNNLALALGHAGQTEESLALFRQVSGEAAAWVNLGYVHVSLGEGEKAAECFAKALSIDDRLESAANALIQIADLQQEAEQRAARNQQIASVKKTRQREKVNESPDGIVQVVGSDANDSETQKGSAIMLAHGTARAQSVLKKKPAQVQTSAPSN